MYTADFETTTNEEDCRVWAYSICNIKDFSDFKYGNNIDEFIEFCKDKKHNYKIWFHNLKFDGEYIFYYLLTHDYKCIKDKKDRKNKTFTCLISDTGQFYSIEIYFEVNGKHSNKVTIYDSLKILNFSVDKIAKDFNLPIRKLELDYHKIRKVGHILTQEEIDYIRNDVEIMARALKTMFDQKLDKMTIGSDALSSYKETISGFKDYYPVLPVEIDEEIRKSYKGGWVYLNPIYKEKHLKDGIVIDKNSMYPSHMYYDYLPFGEPQFFEGQYKKDVTYPLYIQTLTCSFKIKENKLPTIQLKNTIGFMPNEYIESSNDEMITLTLTNIDLNLFFEHYNVENIVYHCGYKFRRIKGLFKNYIDKWTESKIKAKKDENGALYLTSKLMLNSLYGKFGLNPNVRGKYPIIDENGIIHYKLYEPEIRDSIYCPTASFITSLSRNDIIRTSQKIRDYTLEKYNKDYFIYSDTDSIHCLKLTEEELSKLVELDKYKLGAWDMETQWEEAIFIRQKCYIEKEHNGKIKTTIAGLPKKLGKYITFENFKPGFQVLASEKDKEHKLRFKHVKGGVLLVDTDFTIK